MALRDVPSAVTEAELTFLDGLEIGDNGADIVTREYELRHVRMAGDDSLAQGFLQRLDGIALSEGTEQWSLRVPTFAGAGDCMAARAILGEKRFPPLKGRVFGIRSRCGKGQTKSDQ